MILALVLALVAADPPEQTFSATVARPRNYDSDPWVEVTDDPWGLGSTFVHIDDAEIVWHLDPAVSLPRSTLQPGVRIRYTGRDCNRASLVEVVCLGPLACAVAVEEFVAEAAGGRFGCWCGRGTTATPR